MKFIGTLIMQIKSYLIIMISVICVLFLVAERSYIRFSTTLRVLHALHCLLITNLRLYVSDNLNATLKLRFEGMLHLRQRHTDVIALGIVDAHAFERLPNFLIFNKFGNGQNVEILA